MMGWVMTFREHRAAPSPLVGEGWGGGACRSGTAVPHPPTPTPDPSPQGGGEKRRVAGEGVWP